MCFDEIGMTIDGQTSGAILGTAAALTVPAGGWGAMALSQAAIAATTAASTAAAVTGAAVSGTGAAAAASTGLSDVREFLGLGEKYRIPIPGSLGDNDSTDVTSFAVSSNSPEQNMLVNSGKKRQIIFNKTPSLLQVVSSLVTSGILGKTNIRVRSASLDTRKEIPSEFGLDINNKDEKGVPRVKWDVDGESNIPEEAQKKWYSHRKEHGWWLHFQEPCDDPKKCVGGNTLKLEFMAPSTVRERLQNVGITSVFETLKEVLPNFNTKVDKRNKLFGVLHNGETQLEEDSQKLLEYIIKIVNDIVASNSGTFKELLTNPEDFGDGTLKNNYDVLNEASASGSDPSASEPSS